MPDILVIDIQSLVRLVSDTYHPICTVVLMKKLNLKHLTLDCDQATT